jgi:hypothetical protein
MISIDLQSSGRKAVFNAIQTWDLGGAIGHRLGLGQHSEKRKHETKSNRQPVLHRTPPSTQADILVLWDACRFIHSSRILAYVLVVKLILAS